MRIAATTCRTTCGRISSATAIVATSRRAHLERVREALSDAIHRVLQDTLGLPADKRFRRFLALDDSGFGHPPDRGKGYTILELAMFAGRTDQTKRVFAA